MKHAILLVAVCSIALGAGLVIFGGIGRDGVTGPLATSGSGTPVSEAASADSLPALERMERDLKVKKGSKNAVGEFELRGGRKLRLHTVETTDGKSCLIDEDPAVGPGATCLEDGLFAFRKVALFVNSDGGPELFRELYVGGVAAPGIATVLLSMTDGSSVDLPLTRDGAFLFESTAVDLELSILPNGLRLYGSSGKLVQVVNFPPAG